MKSKSIDIENLSTSGVRIKAHTGFLVILHSLLLAFILLFSIWVVIFVGDYGFLVITAFGLIQGLPVAWSFFGSDILKRQGGSFLLKKSLFRMGFCDEIPLCTVKEVTYNDIDFSEYVTSWQALKHYGFGKGKVVLSVSGKADYSLGMGLSDYNARILVLDLQKVVEEYQEDRLQVLSDWVELTLNRGDGESCKCFVEWYIPWFDLQQEELFIESLELGVLLKELHTSSVPYTKDYKAKGLESVAPENKELLRQLNAVLSAITVFKSKC